MTNVLVLDLGTRRVYARGRRFPRVAALVSAWPFSSDVHGLTAAATMQVVAVDRRATGSVALRTRNEVAISFRAPRPEVDGYRRRKAATVIDRRYN
jgi:hypothetical protein